MVNNWVGLLEKNIKVVEEIRVQIQWMNAEAQSITNPIEQQVKFSKIQEVYNKLDEMYEASQTTKRELMEFKIVVQAIYVQMHQLNFVVNAECNTLLSTKPRNWMLQ